MNLAPAVIAGAVVLAGCQHQMTLEEARAQCTKQGGFLVVFYTQKVTLSGAGPEIASPGNCVSSSNFDKPPAGSAPAAPDSNAPAPAPPQSGKPPPAAAN